MWRADGERARRRVRVRTPRGQVVGPFWMRRCGESYLYAFRAEPKHVCSIVRMKQASDWRASPGSASFRIEASVWRCLRHFAETDCVSGHVELELGNVYACYVFEIRNNSSRLGRKPSHRDPARLSR